VDTLNALLIVADRPGQQMGRFPLKLILQNFSQMTTQAKKKRNDFIVKIGKHFMKFENYHDQ
jgi:hypothetical protein